LVNSFNPSTTITNVVDNGGGSYTISVCNTLNIRELSPFKVNANNETAKSVDTELKTITYETGTPPQKFDIVYGAKPFFFHGTPIATGNELSLILESGSKLPMVYLLEIITDTLDRNPESSIERTTQVNLFFLDEANFGDWDTDEHYSQAVIPMMNYAEAFLDYLDNAPLVGVIDTAPMTYHAKFGLEIRTNSGHVKNLFPEELSGVQVTITLPLLKDLSCSDACN